jgi:hypothetical protein
MGIAGLGTRVSTFAAAKNCTPAQWLEAQVQLLAQHLEILMHDADPSLLSSRSRTQLQQMGRQLGGLLAPLQGYLTKRGKGVFHTKKECFFVLLEDRLVFFNTEAEAKNAGTAPATEKHTFSLSTMRTVQPTGEEAGKQFEIRRTNDNPLLLTANTAEEARDWVFRLQLALASRTQRG